MKADGNPASARAKGGPRQAPWCHMFGQAVNVGSNIPGYQNAGLSFGSVWPVS